jgi:hypothetical protein
LRKRSYRSPAGPIFSQLTPNATTQSTRFNLIFYSILL